jgi:D-alanine transaminase
MSIVYLNGTFLPMQQATISPMDRGFLFGDGIYEVIPSYGGKFVGFKAHIERLKSGLAELMIREPEIDWYAMLSSLVAQNGSGDLGLYLHVSRGADERRFHAYSDPTKVSPTVYAFAFQIGSEPIADPAKTKRYRCGMTEDKRWRRCHIKSTALLGNVMHFQEGQSAGLDEMILHNAQGQVTEASACNVFMVKQGVVYTAPLDDQLLPGITRALVIDILAKYSDIEVREEFFDKSELLAADEVWITSSSKEIVPVIEVAGQKIGHGEPGAIWCRAQKLFSDHKYEY